MKIRIITSVAAASALALSLAACAKKTAAPACGTSDTPACATAGPAPADGGPVQQK